MNIDMSHVVSIPRRWMLQLRDLDTKLQLTIDAKARAEAEYVSALAARDDLISILLEARGLPTNQVTVNWDTDEISVVLEQPIIVLEPDPARAERGDTNTETEQL